MQRLTNQALSPAKDTLEFVLVRLLHNFENEQAGVEEELRGSIN